MDGLKGRLEALRVDPAGFGKTLGVGVLGRLSMMTELKPASTATLEMNLETWPPPKMINRRGGQDRFTKTSILPPQISPASRLEVSVRSKSRRLGFSASITWRAAFQTSFSTQPPPTVPKVDPSSRTRILAVSKLGTEPRI